jgi:hypothetical protein
MAAQNVRGAQITPLKIRDSLACRDAGPHVPFACWQAANVARVVAEGTSHLVQPASELLTDMSMQLISTLQAATLQHRDALTPYDIQQLQLRVRDLIVSTSASICQALPSPSTASAADATEFIERLGHSEADLSAATAQLALQTVRALQGGINEAPTSLLPAAPTAGGLDGLLQVMASMLPSKGQHCPGVTSNRNAARAIESELLPLLWQFPLKEHSLSQEGWAALCMLDARVCRRGEHTCRAILLMRIGFYFARIIALLTYKMLRC